jgi:hypothetical protein
MAKKGRNSGFVKQDGIVAQFLKAARSESSQTDAAAQAIREGIRNTELLAERAKQQKEAPRMSLNFLTKR